jgi:multiple sugar transport system permease protein
MFDIIWLLTQGGPAGKTQHLPVLAYLKVFRGSYSISEGATISIFMFLFLLIFMLIYLKVQKFEQR